MGGFIRYSVLITKYVQSHTLDRKKTPYYKVTQCTAVAILPIKIGGRVNLNSGTGLL